MKIIFKLTLGFMFISILVGFLAYMGYNSTISIKNEYDRVAFETVPVLESLNSIKLAGIRIIDTTNELVALSSQDKIIKIVDNEELAEANKTLEKSFKDYEIQVHTYFPEENETLENIRNSTQNIVRLNHELIELRKKNFIDNMPKIKKKQLELTEVETKFLNFIDIAIETENKELKERTENGEKKIIEMRNNSILLGFFTFLVAISTGFFISNRLSTPIINLKNASIEIGKGNLDTIIDIKTKDEIEDLSTSFNKMTQDLKKSNDETISAKNFANNIIRSMVDTLVVLNFDNNIKIVNNSFLDLLGYKENELIGKSINIILDEDLKKNFTNDKEIIEKKTFISCEGNYLTKKGEKIPVAFLASIMYDKEGKIEGIVCVARDITEPKIINEKIKKSLEEKEILLREIHHRVKNNMQIISSLLMLQSQYIKNKEDADIFVDSQNRIVSMSLIHEKLYQSSDLSKIDFKEYIEEMLSGLFQSYGVNSGNIALNIKVDNISMAIDSAIPCGLIINELVTNSLKYAFPEGRNGEITISLRSIDGTMIELVVGDNGVGIPKDLDIRTTESLGLHLVTILAENQLHGNIALNRDKGTEFQIKFRG